MPQDRTAGRTCEREQQRVEMARRGVTDERRARTVQGEDGTSNLVADYFTTMLHPSEETA